MTTEPSVPLPLDPSPPPEADDKRLWVGNIDVRLTEYHLLKLLQQYGKMMKFDFLFHKSGPLKGQPRGYCFVTYENRVQAINALTALNGKVVLNKNLIVKWAHTVPTDEIPTKKPIIPGLQTDESKTANKSVYSQISAIEAKLKAMEEQPDKELEFSLSSVAVTEGVSWQQPRKPVNKCNRRTRDGPYTRLEHRQYTARSLKRR